MVGNEWNNFVSGSALTMYRVNHSRAHKRAVAFPTRTLRLLQLHSGVPMDLKFHWRGKATTNAKEFPFVKIVPVSADRISRPATVRVIDASNILYRPAVFLRSFNNLTAACLRAFPTQSIVQFSPLDFHAEGCCVSARRGPSMASDRPAIEIYELAKQIRERAR